MIANAIPRTLADLRKRDDEVRRRTVEQIVAMVPGWYIGGRLTNKAQIEQIERQIRAVLA